MFQGRQLRLTHPHRDAEAGDPRLGDLELRLADDVPVADADLVVGQAVDSEILAERAVALVNFGGRVGQERILEALLLFEAAVAGHGVSAHAEHHRG